MTYEDLSVDYLIDLYKIEKLFFISYKQINITDMNTYNKLLLDEIQAKANVLAKYLDSANITIGDILNISSNLENTIDNHCISSYNISHITIIYSSMTYEDLSVGHLID